MTYNPYELVEITINGQQMTGRPTAFDGEITDFTKMTDGFNKLVHPSELSTVCPDCGQGLQLSVSLPDPPFPVREFTCPHCRPQGAIQADPFNNPVESGKVEKHEFDPLLRKPSTEVKLEQENSVADRVEMSGLSEDTQEDTELPSPEASEHAVDDSLVDLLDGKKTPKKNFEEPPSEQQGQTPQADTDRVNEESGAGTTDEAPTAPSSSRKTTKKTTKKSSSKKKSSSTKRTGQSQQSGTSKAKSMPDQQEQEDAPERTQPDQQRSHVSFDDSDLTES